jgi:hypothetical protein
MELDKLGFGLRPALPADRRFIYDSWWRSSLKPYLQKTYKPFGNRAPEPDKLKAFVQVKAHNGAFVCLYDIDRPHIIIGWSGEDWTYVKLGFRGQGLGRMLTECQKGS